MPRPLAVRLAVLACGLLAAVAAPVAVAAPEDLLPAAEYDPAVPRPADVLGFEVGEWHARHDQVVAYAEALAAASPRVRYELQGRTHEGRPLPLLVISSPGNLARLDEVRERHVALSEPPYAAGPDLEGAPVVVWLGYSIHGNEASGANAALLVAYHLAAAGGDTAELLRDVVVLLDPSLNPDGLGRFAQWANSHRGHVLVGDRVHREHDEGWPSGRTNHYWFDLNRDWLPAQHPETRARLATLRDWRPNLLADFHEMGSDATYFFQPGVPSRQNPLTPAANLELTRRIARYHADAFDAAGRLYYSEETFDDFYYGKGSTYPDVQGAVGILFEQASARGHLMATENGPLPFREAIRGHVLTSFSTLRAAHDLRRDLLAYQADFARRAAADAAGADAAAWLVADGGDPVRAWHLLDLLAAHGVEVRELTAEVELAGTTFRPGRAWAVPLGQRQYRLVEALFERRLEFADETFYDVSAWTLPLAFDLPFARLPRERAVQRLLGPPVAAPAPPQGRLPADAGAPPYAWLFEWNGYFAPRALQRLLAAGAVARVATRPFEARTDAGPRRFGYGTIVVPAGLQELPAEELAALLRAAAADDGVDVWAVRSGLTGAGVDFGSPSLRPLELPRPLLVVGDGVASYEAGEVWHLLDRRFAMPLPLVERGRLADVDLGDYTHVVLVDGRWDDLDEAAVERLRGWLRRGGTVVATQGAASWAEEALAGERREEGEEKEEEGAAAAGRRQAARPAGSRAAGTGAPEPPAGGLGTYADYERRAAVDLVSGAIFEAELDLTHPLAFGFGDRLLPVFRDGARPLAPSDNPYENVALFTARPHLAGYASPANVEKIAGSAAVVASRVGDGTLVRMSDDPAFRAFWYGTDRLLLNSLFFSPVVKRTRMPAE
jgi:hypothetical protein